LPKLNNKTLLFILILSSALGLIFNWINQKGISLIAQEKALKWRMGNLLVTPDTNEPYAINLEQAKELYEQNELFIDAREKEEFEAGHIRGAVNIPFDNIDNYIEEINRIPKNEIVITYCSGTDCDLSILLGNKLSEMGYKNVYIFFGGWMKWLNSGYPIESQTKNEKNSKQ
jgi:rhodanese-related sulfurtransferase